MTNATNADADMLTRLSDVVRTRGLGLDDARAVLDAVAPAIAARALREAAAMVAPTLGSEVHGHTHTYAVRLYLQERADEIEAGAMTAPTLTEFLLARIAEDEAAAREALEQGSEPEPEPWLAIGWPRSEHPGPVVLVGPERFVAECEAKRRLVANHGGRHVCEDGMAGERWDEDVNDIVESPCEDLRILGTIYADHPKYDESWRP